MLVFEWGKKRGRGGKNKDVQFYESFTYDEEDYSLYDCVYMYKEGEPAPYIGKLIKMWETADGMRKVKVQWFFRPSEVSYYLKDAKVLENELFFASGNGIGLADLNPVEAVAGKCNVICISTDQRNPQASAEEIQMADYVFYRIFDVGSCTISDQIDDKVGGLEVNFVFNRRECIRTLDSPKLVSAEKNEERNVVESNICEKKDESKDLKSPVSLVQAEKGMKKVAGKSCALDDVPSNREKFDGSIASESNGVQGLIVLRNDAAHPSTSATISKGNVGCRKDAKLSENSSPLDEKLLKTSLSKDASRSGHGEDFVGLKKNSKSNGHLNASQGNVSKTKEKSNLGHDKSREDKEGSEPAAKQLQNSSTSKKRTLEISVEAYKEKSNLEYDKSHENKEGSKEAAKPLQNLSTSTKSALEISTKDSEENPNLGHVKSLGKEQKLNNTSCPKVEGYPKKAKLDDSVEQLEVNNNSKTKNLKENNLLSKSKISPKCATSSDNNVKSKMDERPSNEYCNAKAKTNVGEAKNLAKFVALDNKPKLRLGEGPSNEYHNEKDGKLLNDNLPNPFTLKVKDDGGKARCKVIEVTSKPPDKPSWMKYTWDELMKTAHDQGKLVLLQNLDPQYTSGEVECIIWHTFQEDCKARMVPHTAISNPYSGQAFVVFKSRDAANRVVRELDERCLMLPNQRPLVACHAVLPKSSEKQNTFVGHLVIDKDRRQIQRMTRDWKEALSTSHYSQNNTIEYSMAMDWCLLQLQSDKWWGNLHEQQRRELKKLMEKISNQSKR